ncbi:hypothetical protein [Streptomyces sp. NBC_01012]|uniref:hypothetical protein n=1 Tax=Streptomyces sp. NBC_01012 TaxID=2903717 RepID=UPI00386FF5CF|nr:hypothetical protein OG623_20365 [Streptomyces sp. NBC_01012]
MSASPSAPGIAEVLGRVAVARLLVQQALVLADEDGARDACDAVFAVHEPAGRGLVKPMV